MSSIQLENNRAQTKTDLKELAQDMVQRAMRSGATSAECVIREGDEFSTLVRLGQVETLKESGSKSIGVRVFNGKRAASTHSSDFTSAGLDRMLKSAIELAKITSEDPFSGIPEESQLGSLPGDLDLYSADVYSLPGEERISYAQRAEKAALDFDPRMNNSEGGSFDAATGHKIWPTRMASWASSADRIAQLPRFRLRKMKKAACNAIIGFRLRATLSDWSLPSM